MQASSCALAPVDPSNFLAWQAIAVARYRFGEYDEAAIAVQKTIDINPRFSDWAYTWGCGGVRRGDKAQA